MPGSISAKTILNKKKKRDAWFLDDYTINPYSGCSFNCVYCYIRGSKYGIHMEQKLSIKENALEVLEKQLKLRASKNQQGIIVLSSSTDPYLPFDEGLELTRNMLKLILKYRFPVHVITKSDRVVNDFDILKEIEDVAILPSDLEDHLKHRVFITFSFSTTQDNIGKIFEPGATPPSLRMEALKKSLQAKFHSGVSLMPLLPFITDTEQELRKMFQAFDEVGIDYIFPASITLFGDGPADSKTLMLRQVEKHYPELSAGYKRLFNNSWSNLNAHQEAVNQLTKSLCQEFGMKASLFS